VTFAVRGWDRIKGAARRALRDQADLFAAVWGANALEPVVVEWS
jgi:hypothetical protein